MENKQNSIVCFEQLGEGAFFSHNKITYKKLNNSYAAKIETEHTYKPELNSYFDGPTKVIVQ